MTVQTEATHQHLRETQRAKILAGAREAFARQGMATTMADVAKAAGVSQGLAYRYFTSKEEIVRELVEQAIHAGPAALQPFLTGPATPGERLSRLVTSLVESRREQPEFYQLLDQVQNAETLPDALREQIRQRGQTFFEVGRRLMVEGQATGEIAAGDPDQLMLALIACLEGITKLAVWDRERFQQHGPDAAILLRMLKPDSTQR